MSFERFLSIKFIKWRNYFKTKEAIISSIIMGFTLSIINASFVATINFDMTTSNTTCFVDDEYTSAMEVNKFHQNIINDLT